MRDTECVPYVVLHRGREFEEVTLRDYRRLCASGKMRALDTLWHLYAAGCTREGDRRSEHSECPTCHDSRFVKQEEVIAGMIAAGMITGLSAAPFGAIDWVAIPSGTRAKRVGALHGIGNVVVVLLFAVT